MAVDPPLFHRALSLALDMGPQTRVPLAERLAQAVPEQPPDARAAAIAEAHEARRFAYEIACRVQDKVITDRDALAEIRARYPSLDETLALRLRGHGYYLAVM